MEKDNNVDQFKHDILHHMADLEKFFEEWKKKLDMIMNEEYLKENKEEKKEDG